ncbi:MAG: ATP-binding protein, partial [Syntrophobacteraceae bacterium]|nr:ATP-binding protein [Syntrophobacteraceae bacterium]
IAQDRRNKLHSWYEERLGDIRVLSRLSAIRDLCSAGGSPSSEKECTSRAAVANDLLALTRGKSLAYESIHLISLSGKVLASTEPSSEMIISKMYLEDLRNMEVANGPVLSHLMQHTNREWYIHLTVPVDSKDGKMTAAVFSVLDALGTLDPILSDRTGLGKTGEAYLVDKDGEIVTKSRFLSLKETAKRRFKTFGIASAIARKDGISIFRNYMGREVVGCYRWLPRFHSGLLVEIQKNEILAPVKAIRTAVLTMAALVILICFMASFLLSRQISRPISQMAKASREMANGSLDQRISYSRRDEIGTLSESFNSMAEDLSSLIGSLKQKEISIQRAYDELMQAQQQLVQSEKMAAIGELVAGVVHEMRNPLSSVKLNFQIIGRSLGRMTPLHEHYSIGLDQIAQLEKMLSSLLDYSKPISLGKVPFQLDTIVAESILQLQPFTGGRAIEVKTVGPIPNVMGDPEQIRQVLTNVIKNAIESAGPSGKVDVTIKAAGENTNNGPLIEVRDNGPGISRQDIKRIFQPFFTTKKDGTGLGLSIVKKIMEAHGFRVSISSEEGAGAVVGLHFQTK